MPLSLEDFAGFDLVAVERFLNRFNSATRKKGERYFRSGAVQSLECDEPGVAYAATVQGGELYDVTFAFSRQWTSGCSCPMGYSCKHTYAVLKELLAQYAVCAAAGIGSPSGADTGVAKPAAPAPAPGTLAAALQKKLDRKLTHEESRYLANINRLFRQASTGGLQFRNELTGLGLSQGVNYWDRLELFPGKPPKTEAEFWNYLALYLLEKVKIAIPEFLQPVTDLTVVRERMRRQFRDQEIQRWRQMLANQHYLAGGAADATNGGDAEIEVALRLRFLPQRAIFEWQPGGGDWIELKAGRMKAFDQQYAGRLSPEAALLWLPLAQHIQVFYTPNFTYNDPWMGAQLGRWFHQPVLRPFLVNEGGEPLVFHETPARWHIVPAASEDDDYALSLVQASGEPLPPVWHATETRPAFYLTAEGVFPGPPSDGHLVSAKETTRIPAAALETAHGLRLLQRLKLPPPPRLAARIRTVKLHPGVRAQIKEAWSGTEYCHLEAFGASECGSYVEYWSNDGWVSAAPKSREDLTQLDRSGLAALVPPLSTAGFKWEYSSRCWQMRVTKKFAQPFVAFLKALPPGTRIDLGGELASLKDAEVAGQIRLHASEADLDWFDLRVIVDVNDATLTPAEIKLLLDAKGEWVRLEKKGWRKLAFALSEEEDQQLARLGLTPHQLTSEPQRLHALQLADQAARKFLPAETCDRIERRASELQARVTPEMPPQIQAEMRPYQRDGFHFLAYLATNRFGGILADDMGLGKTLQTLAWLAWLRGRVTAPAPPPSLVVCPKSVVDNWQAEARKFFPTLKVRVWSPSELKTMSGEVASADLHVINYSQLRLVGEELAREKFHAVILDEGQYIKNPSSQTAQIARQLRAEHRLILSGTPIENRLLDLWSLMSFAMPGALGSRAEFQRLYDPKNDPFARQRLSARVRPFLIRRTKAQVARDLPDRTEEDLFCELEGEQKTLYRAELKRAQAMLLGIKTAAALNKKRFNFLTSLLRLRQICCHPKLVNPTSKAPSAKVEALLETLEPLIEEGEKVLVFSQFVELLEILRREMQDRGWLHWYLAGDTENRGDVVNAFQSAEGAGVFLISLKAGGFGLNLTAASYVVLFDPWWNPAVENQAIDRTHRIGQTSKVIAYRLLIKDSIEEKIRALQRQKKSLAEDVLGEEKFSQSLSLDDLRYLLEP